MSEKIIDSLYTIIEDVERGMETLSKKHFNDKTLGDVIARQSTAITTLANIMLRKEQVKSIKRYHGTKRF